METRAEKSNWRAQKNDRKLQKMIFYKKRARQKPRPEGGAPPYIAPQHCAHVFERGGIFWPLPRSACERLRRSAPIELNWSAEVTWR
jgi:hypothetical protein